MNHDDDLSEQLAAYALDALDDDERVAVDAVLDASPRARAELARYEAVAGLLGETADTEELPAGSWERLAAHLTTGTAPAPELPVLDPLEAMAPVGDLAAARARRGGRAPRAVAVAAAAAALVLGGVVLHQREEIDDARAASSPTGAAAAALGRPGARLATLASDDARVTVRAVLDERGRAYLFADSLPALAEDRTYQLWSLDGAQPVSLGVLGDRPGIVVVPVPTGLRRIAITAEDAPGASGPTSAPLVVGAFA